MELAALLHDADDKKYFPKNKRYENARSIMDKVLKKKADTFDIALVKKEACEMISYVSASDNGNSVP